MKFVEEGPQGEPRERPNTHPKREPLSDILVERLSERIGIDLKGNDESGSEGMRIPLGFADITIENEEKELHHCVLVPIDPNYRGISPDSELAEFPCGVRTTTATLRDHVCRATEKLGNEWYEGGMLLCKVSTNKATEQPFDSFIAIRALQPTARVPDVWKVEGRWCVVDLFPKDGTGESKTIFPQSVTGKDIEGGLYNATGRDTRLMFNMGYGSSIIREDADGRTITVSMPEVLHWFSVLPKNRKKWERILEHFLSEEQSGGDLPAA